MKLGICTTDFAPDRAEDLFRRIAAYGYEAIQLNFSAVTETGFLDTPDFEIPWNVDEKVIELISTQAAKAGLAIVAANGTFNAAHPDADIRSEGVARFDGFARAVKALGCLRISMCTGTRSRDGLWTYHPDNDTPEAWADMERTVRSMVAIAEPLGLTLMIETEASNVVNTPEKALKLIESVKSSALKVVMDCANLFHLGTARPENVRPTISNAFDVLGEHIVMAHGKDIAASDGIDFTATGRGIIDFDYFFERLRRIGFQGDMVLHGIFDLEEIGRAFAFIWPMVRAFA